MPTSDYHQISDVLHVVEQVNPQRVLDVGVGFGKWGFLCREILEVYNERVARETWTRVIDGIEIHEPYRNEFWPLVYNDVHIGDARQVLPRLGRYDLILCCDVIEHFDKDHGLALIELMLQHTDVLVLTSPRGYHAQGAVYSNEHERHRSGWEEKDFEAWPHLYLDVGFTFLAVIGRIEGIRLRHPMDVLGFKKGARALLQHLIKKAR